MLIMVDKGMFFGHTKDIKILGRDEGRQLIARVRTDSVAIVSMSFRESDDKALSELARSPHRYRHGYVQEVEKGVFKLRSGLDESLEVILSGNIFGPVEIIEDLHGRIARKRGLSVELDDDLTWGAKDRDSGISMVMECVKDIESLSLDAKCDESLKAEVGRIRYDIEFLLNYAYEVGKYHGWDGLIEFLKEHIDPKFEAMKEVFSRIVIQREEES